VDEGVGLGVAQIVGAITAVAGVAVGVWAGVLVGRHLTPYPAPVAEGRLVEMGPYRFVRHPMYSSVILVTTGVGIVALRPWALLISLAFVVFFAAKVGREEELLMEAYPAYREYRSRVPHRLLPWIR
jgi:protein-S-isoprenylcysteine O-methyltransferase Ste14